MPNHKILFTKKQHLPLLQKKSVSNITRGFFWSNFAKLCSDPQLRSDGPAVGRSPRRKSSAYYSDLTSSTGSIRGYLSPPVKWPVLTARVSGSHLLRL